MITVEEARNREILVHTLMALQTGCTERHARQVLQKHGWNADQAAAALLDMAAAEEEMKTGTGSQRQGVVDEWTNGGVLNSSNSPLVMQPRPSSVIDLTGDDDEDTAKAIEASMEPQTMFAPLNRIDMTQWAMVPSNAPPALSQEDQALNRALEASLTSSFASVAREAYNEPTDPIARVRKDGWPTALRSTNCAICYAPIVMQCLMSLPQLRRRLLHYNTECVGVDEYHVFTQRLQRLAAILEHTTRAYVAIDDILDSLIAPRPISNHQPLPSLIFQYYTQFAHAMEFIPRHPDDPGSHTPLLNFHGIATDAGVMEMSMSYASGSTIDLFVPSPSGNDLVSCMTHTFSRSDVCLIQLSECVTFIIRRQDGAGLSTAPFKYPPRIYLDRFMQENLERANELRDCQEGIHHEIERLLTDRVKLSSWKNEDTLTDLRSSAQYFENLASDGGDPIRKEAQERTKVKLLKTIEEIETNIKNIDSRIKDLTADAEGFFDMPDLQNHGYDLCAVIIHDGLFGRNHVYSYTKDEKGNWWKIVDYHVSQVSEDIVLNDNTGIHLGAGPLLLFYSQSEPSHLSLGGYEEPSWPRFATELVHRENSVFLAQLPRKVAALVASRSDVRDDGLLDGVSETCLLGAKRNRESLDGNGSS